LHFSPSQDHTTSQPPVVQRGAFHVSVSAFESHQSSLSLCYTSSSDVEACLLNCQVLFAPTMTSIIRIKENIIDVTKAVHTKTDEKHYS